MNNLLVAAFKTWFRHGASSRGAALAFYALFSLTPTLLIAVYLAGQFFGSDTARSEIQLQIEYLVGPNAAQVVQALLLASRDAASGTQATTLAGVLLLIGATSVFVELKDSLDAIWETQPRQQSVLWLILKSRLLAFSLVLVLALLLLLSLLLSAALVMLDSLIAPVLGSATGLIKLLSVPFSLLLLAILFAVINKTLPEVRLAWSDAWIGAVFTALLFSPGNYAIGLYLSHNAVASSFGAAGSLIALLLWIYFSAQIFLFGAAFTRQYALHHGSLKSATTTGPLNLES